MTDFEPVLKYRSRFIAFFHDVFRKKPVTYTA